jgi:hypothetical protein
MSKDLFFNDAMIDWAIKTDHAYCIQLLQEMQARGTVFDIDITSISHEDAMKVLREVSNALQTEIPEERVLH